MKLKITRIIATPVVVPPRPDSIMSEGIEDDWSKAPGIGKTSGGSTAKFPELPKYILRAETNRGLAGIGETYRDSNVDNLHRNAAALLNKPLAELALANLPIPLDREYDGFELLAYDLVGKELQTPVHRLLGGRCRDKVYVSTWSGRRYPNEAARKALEGKQLGFDAIKFKCNDKDDVAAWAREIVEQCGPEMKMIFDPNQRWGDYETASRIMMKLADFNVVCVEDPIKRDRYDDYRRLRGVGGLKVCIHVALPYCIHGQSITDALEAIRHDACDGFNFNGPMAPFVQLAGLAKLARKPCWHGSEIDLGIMEAGAVHAAAAAPACTWPSDILGRLVREHDLLTQPLDICNSYVAIPETPGLGVTLDLQALEKYRAGEALILAAE